MTSVGSIKSVLQNDQVFRADIDTNNANVVGDMNVTGESQFDGSVAYSSIVVSSNPSTATLLAFADDTQLLTGATGQIILFKTVTSNVGGGFVPATGIYTVPTTGYYYYTVSISVLYATTTPYNLISIRVNGVATNNVIFGRSFSNSVANSLGTLSGMIYLESGDDVDINIINSANGVLIESSSFINFILISS